jgi:peptidoglycan hydrolase-like amidase
MDRKFPWEIYDWIDDPDVFQKYLWYGLESRSSNINKVVNDTKWMIITYNWKIIKPWYFSSSDWKTMSYYDYCKINNPKSICLTEAKKYPFLQSVEDKWSVWKVKAWHWVWISWAWVSYYAKKWWSYDMIIKYFLKGVSVS